MKIKDGVKTTEFWLPIIKLLIGLLITAGILSTTTAESEIIAQLIAAALVAAVTLYTSSKEVAEYINGRSLLKTTAQAAVSTNGTVTTELAE